MGLLKHKHNWKLTHTVWETIGYSTTRTQQFQKEFAYLLCKCGEVIKVEVKNKPSPLPIK